MATAATYQITMSARTVVASGASRSTSGWRANVAGARTGSASELLVIGVSRTQARAHPLRDLEEFGRLPDFQRAVAGKIAIDDIDDAAGARRHHHDLGREEHRFRDRVGDEQHGLLGRIPELQEVLGG